MEKARSNAGSQAKWTFMVYMAGDNNLDGAALRDIAEMARAGSTKDVNILVQLDRIEDNLTRRFRVLLVMDRFVSDWSDWILDLSEVLYLG